MRRATDTYRHTCMLWLHPRSMLVAVLWDTSIAAVAMGILLAQFRAWAWAWGLLALTGCAAPSHGPTSTEVHGE